MRRRMPAFSLPFALMLASGLSTGAASLPRDAGAIERFMKGE